MHGSFYVCPVCDELVELMEAIGHILRVHPQSGVAFAIRAEADRAWVEAAR
jgi:hypothetical protein